MDQTVLTPVSGRHPAGQLERRNNSTLVHISTSGWLFKRQTSQTPPRPYALGRVRIGGSDNIQQSGSIRQQQP